MNGSNCLKKNSNYYYFFIIYLLIFSVNGEHRSVHRRSHLRQRSIGRRTIKLEKWQQSGPRYESRVQVHEPRSRLV